MNGILFIRGSIETENSKDLAFAIVEEIKAARARYNINSESFNAKLDVLENLSHSGFVFQNGLYLEIDKWNLRIKPVYFCDKIKGYDINCKLEN